MTDELNQLIEDAAKLLPLTDYQRAYFDPCDPERGDLMKVADAAELRIDFQTSTVTLPVMGRDELATMLTFTKGDYQSLALAVLRAASAVYKSKGESK